MNIEEDLNVKGNVNMNSNLNIGLINSAGRAGIKKGLRLAANQVLMDSKEICPHDTGLLENSGATEVSDTKAQVFYDTPYAA